MANPFSKDSWDWPFILYAGRVWLGYTDEEVMNLTPRKLQALLNVHYDVLEKMHGGGDNGKTNNLTTGYIDQIPGW